jgi:DNA modification methylase
MLPSEFCGTVLDHFSSSGDVILDPMCGSGMFGVIGELFYPDRRFLLSDINRNVLKVYKSLLEYYRSKDIFYYKSDD